MSDLPTYEAYDKQFGATLDLEATTMDDEDYYDHLCAREKTVGLRNQAQNSRKPLLGLMEFEFLDKPGLCNHEGKDSVHAENITKAITTSRTFNLILIVANPHDPVTVDFQLALQYYSEALHGMRFNIAFVFTRVDYAHSHHNYSDGHSDLQEKVN
ncbi:hypothetical protein BGZ52_009679 [Haplosporangium bisporale]|nr:hypothetical protein BGZ52_009679 [Haplosporangium bisporale]